jgi:hypothetical protein
MGKQLSGRGEERSQQRNAGKKSASVRAERADVRRLIVKAAFSRLLSKYQMQPYSDEAIGALQEECTKMPARIKYPDDEDFDCLFSLAMDGHKIQIQVPRETLIKDMKQLGIRSKRRTQRSR